MKCLNKVLRCASAPRVQIWGKCEWYMCAYTRNSLVKIFRTTSGKFPGKSAPCACGNKASSSTCDSTHVRR